MTSQCREQAFPGLLPAGWKTDSRVSRIRYWVVKDDKKIKRERLAPFLCNRNITGLSLLAQSVDFRKKLDYPLVKLGVERIEIVFLDQFPLCGEEEVDLLLRGEDQDLGIVAQLDLQGISRR